MTFSHRFSDSLSVRLTIEDGETLMQSFRWTGDPLQIHRGEFVRWLHTVYRHLADILGAELTSVVHDGPRAQYWVYRPFHVPRLEKTIYD